MVSALTPSLLEEIFEVRMYLEALALGAAVPRMSQADLADLEALVAQMDREGDHRRILEACRAGRVTQAQKELEMHLSGTLAILTNTLRVAGREDA